VAWAASVFLTISCGSRTPAVSEKRSDSGYVDPSKCAGCHADIAKNYRLTGMGRSFHHATAERDGKDYQSFSSLYNRASDRYYKGVVRGNELFQQRHQLGFGGKETNTLEKKVDFVIGSGNHARTYLSRTPDGHLAELPATWYAEKGGTWAMSPGYDRPDQDDFRRPIPYECMFCHNGYPAVKPGADLAGAKPVFDANLPEGIDCQRCHGPGAAHLAALNSGRAKPEEIRRTIVNPARLSRDRQLEVCMQCHLESSSRPLPYSIRRYERGVFSYRPGEPLADYSLHFDQKPKEGQDRFEIAGAGYRLRQSACFRNSEMTCLTCHDPHDIPRGLEAKQHYVSVCRSCHATSNHVVQMNTSANCLDCHMPKRRAQDAVHTVMTDHYIQRRKPAGDLLAPIKELGEKENSYRGEVVPYYPNPFPPAPDSDLYLAVAQVKDGANLQSGIPRLQQAVESQKPSRAEFYFELGNGYSKAQNPEAAIHWLDEALRIDANFTPATRALVAALFAAGQTERAAVVINQAREKSGPDPVLLTNLGNAYLQAGKLDGAEQALGEAANLNPDLAETQNLLGLLALQKGDRTGAETRFREAIRIQPDLALAHNNLANLLGEAHNYAEAQYHFEKTIALDPNYTAAHHRYGLLLEVMGAYDKALAELRHTLRLDPSLADAHNELADLLAAKGQVQSACDEYEEAIRLKPDLYEAHLSLGTILTRKGDVQRARQHFEAASHSTDPAVRDPALRAMSR
jgi:tetratricopeptide (TPR) repeat protein